MKKKPPSLYYMICTTPRSGSWLLAEGLKSTGMAGNPQEWYNKQGEPQRFEQWKLQKGDYARYLRKIIKRGTSGNGVFGIKCHLDQFFTLQDKYGAPNQNQTMPEIIKSMFPGLRYIYLTRRDKIRQAISYHCARQTSVWRVWTDEQPSPDEPDMQARATYDAAEIRFWEELFKEKEDIWQSYFASVGQEPLVIHYEELSEDYTETVRKVLRYLGISNADTAPVGEPAFKKLADDRTDEWAERYRKEKPGLPPSGRPLHERLLI